jgi:hypothetical protein
MSSLKRLRIRLAVIVFATTTCSERMPQEARTVLQDRIALLVRKSAHFDVLQAGNGLIKRVAYDAPGTPIFSPDFQTRVRAFSENGKFHVIVESPSVRQSLLEQTVDHTTPARAFDVVWLSPDGSVFAVIFGSRAVVYQRAAGRYDARELSATATGIAASGGKLFVLEGHALRVVSGNGEILSFPIVGAAPTRVVGSPRANEAIVLTESGRSIRTVDTATGTTRILQLRLPAGAVVRAWPLKDTKHLLLEIWRGGERMDGSQLHEFYVCRVDDGQCWFAMTNDANEKIHQLPANVPTPTFAALF